MLKTFVSKARDSNPVVAANIITCIGELISIVGKEATPYVPNVMKIIISELDDSTQARRAALHALGQLCSSTGYVVTPLADFPGLPDSLLKILQTESDKSIRREVVKVLGILGAKDPHGHKVCPHSI